MKPVVTMILAASVAVCLTSAVYGAENGQTMSPGGIVAEVKRQIDRCWVRPEGTGVPRVKVDFQLKRDGTLARDPVVLPVNPGDLQNAQFQMAAKSAMHAVRTCTPLRLPADQYNFWKDVEAVFDPKTYDPKSDPQSLQSDLERIRKLPLAGAKIPSSQHNRETGN
jgi:hypothetical protein